MSCKFMSCIFMSGIFSQPVDMLSWETKKTIRGKDIQGTLLSGECPNPQTEAS